MDDREFDNYLALLSGLLRLRSKQQSAIAQELRDHLVEHVAFLETQKVPHDEAVRRALAEFGDAAALAANFSALVRTRRRRLIMRYTFGTALVLAGSIVGIVALRPELPNNSQRLIAQDAPQQAEVGATEIKPARNAVSDSDEETRQRLTTKTSAEFYDTPLQDILEQLADYHGIQFYFDQRPDRSVDPSQPITLSLKSVPVEMMLDLICRRTGLGYRLRSGVVIVSSEEDLLFQTEVRVFRLREDMAADVVEELAQLIPSTIDVHTWRNNVMAATGAPGTSGGGFFYVGEAIGEGQSPVVACAGQPLPGRANGTIRVFHGALVIAQTPETLRKIEQLLQDLGDVLR